MRTLYLLFIGCLVVFNGFSQSNTYNGGDLKALNALAEKWKNYWNNHDMDSMGTLLRNDVDFVTVGGRWLKGKTEAVNHHKERHQVVFKTSMWQTDSIAIKYVKPDLAIMHIGWGLSGDVDPDGTPRKPRHGIFTWVVIKENNQWLLLTVHNVNINPTVNVAR